MHRKPTPASPGTEHDEQPIEQARPRRPPGGEPVHDEEMFADPLKVLTDAGDEAKNPPAGT